MSPSKDKIMAAPAHTVYKRNKNKPKVNKVQEIITIESDVEEITRMYDPILFTKKKRRSATPFTVESNSTVVNDTNRKKKTKVNDVRSYSDVSGTKINSVLKKNAAVSTEQHEYSRERMQERERSSSERSDSPVGHSLYLSSGDSIVDGKKLFDWLIQPQTSEEFFRTYWEHTPLYVKRRTSTYFKTLISTDEIDLMLRKNNVYFTENIDVTKYTNGTRKTLNPTGRAHPNVVWKFYENGCSIRMLNPQIYSSSIRLLNSNLQEFFTSSMGANVYLTPPNSQGFAPHYDDIDGFVLQIEGQKHWKIYKSLNKDQVLPRYPSADLKKEEIGEPFAEITLQPGDLLYLPRGVIHEARTVPGYHSLHITISCYQRNTWGDLLLQLLSGSVEDAINKDEEFRKGLPRGYLGFMGLTHSDEKSPQRTQFVRNIKSLTNKLINTALVDAAVDQMGKQFIHNSLPPVLNQEELQRTSFGSGYKMGDGKVREKTKLTLNTKVKLLRAHILRVTMEEEDMVHVYYSVDNAVQHHGKEIQFFKISHDLALGVDYLVENYPAFVKISELPVDTDVGKMLIADKLWDYKLLIIDEPIQKFNG